MDQLRTSIGSKIRFLRKQAGLTICQLSEVSSVDGGFINCIERGKKTPSLSTLLKIAKALDITLGEIFSEQSPKIENTYDHQVSSQIRAILNRKPLDEREKFLAVLKTLKNKEMLSAIFAILYKKNRARRVLQPE